MAVTVRKIASLTMLTSFVLLILTSIILYIEPQGRVAYWSDWRFWGLSKTQWGNVHLNLGVLLLVAGIFHITYNWKVITAYLKDKTKRIRVFTGNFNVALALTLIVCLGTLLELPPMSTIVSIGNSITDATNQKYGEPPYGHAELSSLKIFAKKTDLDLKKAKILLKGAGIRFKDEYQSILQIAKENHISPRELYAFMKEAAVGSDGGKSFPDNPPPGFGRKTIAQICAGFDLDMKGLLRVLKEKGIVARPEESLKDIAEKNGRNAMSLFEIIHRVATK